MERLPEEEQINGPNEDLDTDVKRQIGVQVSLSLVQKGGRVLKDVFTKRDKERRNVRNRLNLLYRRFMDAEKLNDIQSMVEIDEEIRRLRSCILMIDPLEVSEPDKRKVEKRKRPRLPA